MKITDEKNRLAVVRWSFAAALLAVVAPANAQPEDMQHMRHGSAVYGVVLLDQLEYALGDADAWQWDAQAWIGGDYNRLWLKTEGEHGATGDNGGEAEVQALYSRLVSPFWEFQTGIRYDRVYGEDDASRVHAVIGLEGLAPYWFEMAPALFISQKGVMSVRVSAEYDVLLTQRLILQPSIEANVSARTDREVGIGEGLNDLKIGLRLRYEIRREFAPYVGLEWKRAYGGAADIAHGKGEKAEDAAWVAGVRVWF